MELDIARLKSDPNYFAEHILNLNLHEGQKQILASQARMLALRCARRFGKSFLVSAMAAHAASVNSDYKVVCVSRSQRQSGEIFHTIEKILNSSEMKGSIVRQTQTMLELSNGSTIQALPGGSPDSLRGISIDFLLIDEAGFVKKELISVVYPTIISTKGRIVLLSTPQFSSGEFWRACQPESEFTTFHMTHAEAIFANGEPFIDPEELEREIIRCGGIGSDEYTREYLAEFTNAEGAYFDIDDLDIAFSEEHKEIMFGIEGHRYVIGVDLAQTGDYSVFVILDCTDKDNLEVVRTLRFNGLSVEDILLKLYKEARAFNTLNVAIDNAGIGRAILEELLSRWPSIKWTSFNFNKASKPILMTNLSIILNQRRLIIPEQEDFRKEMINFHFKQNQETGSIKLSGTNGAHDDFPIALALAVEATGIFRPQGELSIGLAGNRMLNSKSKRNTKQRIARKNILM